MGVVIHASITKKSPRFLQWSRITKNQAVFPDLKVDKIVTTATVQKDFRFMPSEQRHHSTDSEEESSFHSSTKIKAFAAVV